MKAYSLNSPKLTICKSTKNSKIITKQLVNLLLNYIDLNNFFV